MTSRQTLIRRNLSLLKVRERETTVIFVKQEDQITRCASQHILQNISVGFSHASNEAQTLIHTPHVIQIQCWNTNTWSPAVLTRTPTVWFTSQMCLLAFMQSSVWLWWSHTNIMCVWVTHTHTHTLMHKHFLWSKTGLFIVSVRLDSNITDSDALFKVYLAIYMTLQGTSKNTGITVCMVHNK